jgi:hypothetical protein
MREESLLCRIKKRFVITTTNSHHGFPVYPNVLADVTLSAPDQAWVADFTYVNAAVLAAGELETGITVHLINDHYDQGRILAQCRVPILPTDTPEHLAFRVKAREGTFFVEILRHIAEQGLGKTLEKPSILEGIKL